MAKPLSFTKSIFNAELGLAAGILGILFIMVLPISPFFIDMFLALNITGTIVILFVALYTVEALDFSTFPSILLISTLFRLSLNIASTRLILLNGSTGDAAAGQIIKAFGTTIIGSDYIVGFIVFLILVLINFVVITKGAGRIAEVSARFALDAMPGKQMAIDADLNAGVINDKIAQERRTKIQREADFYGAMDGASKFVRGDAVAGLLITVINIVGGLIIGMLVYDMPIEKALVQFTILTIGDGLVTQIPALLVSTAAGIAVSKAGRQNRLGADFNTQMFSNYKIMTMAGMAVSLFVFIPGAPKFPFVSLGGVFFFLAWRHYQTAKTKAQKVEIDERESAALEDKSEDISSLLPLDNLGLELGYALIPLVDVDQDGEILERIKAIRRQIALDYGFVVPAVHIKDNLDLEAGFYSITIKGVEVGRGEMALNSLLAMKAGEVEFEIDGQKTVEPAFGLPAIWISEAEKEQAQMAGYTVVDVPTVITTHLTEVIKANSHEFLQRQDVQKLLDQTATNQPKLVEELVPGILPLGSVQRVLQGLLKEGISIRNMSTILETLCDYGQHTKIPDLLLEFTRQALSKIITRQYMNKDGVLSVIGLDFEIEKLIGDAIKETNQGMYLNLDPNSAKLIITQIEKKLEVFQVTGQQPIVLTTPKVRPHLKRLTERIIPGLVVLSHNEVAFDSQIESLGIVRLNFAEAAA